MARRGSITESQVFEAADTLTAQGRDVTPTALLQALGSGSYTTIYKHLETWEKSKASATTEKSSTIPDAVLAAFGTAWRTATVEAGKEVAQIRQQATTEVQSIKSKLDETLYTIEQLESDSDLATAKIETLNAQLTEKDAKLIDLERDKASFKATAEQLNLQVKAQHAELDRVHDKLESQRRKHEAEAERLSEQLAELMRQLQESIRANETLTRARDQAINERATADNRSDMLEEQRASAQTASEAAIRESSELRGKCDALILQNQDLLKRLTEKENSDEKKK